MFARTAPPSIQCFESTALPYMKDLYRAAYSMLGGRTEAEDAVQEAYLRAWKAFDRFEPGTNCKAWLFKILVNIVRNHRRSWFVRSRVKDFEMELLDESAVYEQPVADRLTDEELVGALHSLPQAFSEVILLVDVQELTYKEAQDALGIPIGTVMSRLSRGRKMLREKLTVTGVGAAYEAAAVRV
jgi:RNA polymerase sigma-70 factor (ECF subfamily)